MNYTFMRFPGFLDKAVTLSYDDGSIHDKKLVEIMDKHGLKGTFNISSGRFSQDGSWSLTKQQAIDLYTNSGHEVAIHGRDHLSLTELPFAMATNDVLNDRIELERIFDRIITGMAYANGAYDDRIVEIIKNCGVEYARTVVSTEGFGIPNDWLRLPATCHHDNPKLMQLAHSFIEDPPHWYYWGRTPKLFYLWGHSHEFNNHNNWHVIEEFAEYMGGREDVWYATNIEICRYVKAFDTLQFSADGCRVHNPSSTDLYMNYYDKEILVKAGETVKLK